MGFWDGVWDITGDVIEVALPTVGTIFGPAGRLVGGAVGSLVDEAFDGNIDSFDDVVKAAGWGAAGAFGGGMLGGLGARGVARLVPAVGKMDRAAAALDKAAAALPAKTGKKSLRDRVDHVRQRPIEIGKGVGAGAGAVGLDAIRGSNGSVTVIKIPVRELT